MFCFSEKLREDLNFNFLIKLRTTPDWGADCHRQVTHRSKCKGRRGKGDGGVGKPPESRKTTQGPPEDSRNEG